MFFKNVISMNALLDSRMQSMESLISPARRAGTNGSNLLKEKHTVKHKGRHYYVIISD